MNTTSPCLEAIPFGRTRRICNFEPRYDTIAATAEAIQAIKQDFDQTEEYLENSIEAAKSHMYVCDVCTVCGKMISRPPGIMP